MSLNRSEQVLFDYVSQHPEERHFWQHKVRTIVARVGDIPVSVTQLDAELWRYFVERSSVVKSLALIAQPSGSKRISMKNLAEYMIRLWTEPKPKKKPVAEFPGQN